MSVARFKGWPKCDTAGCEAAAVMPIGNAILCYECYSNRDVQLHIPPLPSMPAQPTLEEILRRLTRSAPGADLSAACPGDAGGCMGDCEACSRRRIVGAEGGT